MPHDDKYDRFNDIKNAHAGIFGAEQPGLVSTLANHDKVYTNAAREGLVMEFHCDGCGRPTQITLEWPELVALKYGLNPADAFRNRQGILDGQPMSWTFSRDEQSWRPHQKCRHCGFTFVVRLSPDEPERHLQKGRRMGWIKPAGEDQVARLCAGLAQQMQVRR